MLLRVRHYRVNVNGPHRVVETVVGELTSAGASPADSLAPTCLRVTSADDLESWKALSRRHPDAILGVECFEASEDELERRSLLTTCLQVLALFEAAPELPRETH